jgi:hypothetical protein
MKGLSQLALCALLTGGLAAPAFAQSMNGATPNTDSTAAAPTPNGETGAGAAPNAMNDQSRMQNLGRIAQRIHNQLVKAGFTDIRVMPSSFLVRAKDSSGNPVMMVVNPDSVTAITEENGAAGNTGSNSAAASPNGGPKSTAPGAAQTKP